MTWYEEQMKAWEKKWLSEQKDCLDKFWDDYLKHLKNMK